MRAMASETMRLTIRYLMAVLMLLPLCTTAQPVPEYDIKAAFVYNFALFTDWPADTSFEGGILNICINPSSAMRQPLGGLGVRTVKGKKIAVLHLSALDKLRTCHVLLVDGSDRERWLQIKKGLGGASVLTISEDEDIGHDGSVITLTTEGKRMVFDIDLRAARDARLVLSSKLLRLARTVQ